MTTTTRQATEAEQSAARFIVRRIASIFTDGPARFDADCLARMIRFKLDQFDIDPNLIDGAALHPLYLEYAEEIEGQLPAGKERGQA